MTHGPTALRRLPVTGSGRPWLPRTEVAPSDGIRGRASVSRGRLIPNRFLSGAAQSVVIVAETIRNTLKYKEYLGCAPSFGCQAGRLIRPVSRA